MITRFTVAFILTLSMMLIGSANNVEPEESMFDVGIDEPIDLKTKQPF